MNGLDAVPLWLALPVAVLVVLGSTLTLIGAYGFVRLRGFYDRLHAPTLATSWGTGGVILASMLLASFHQGRPVLHELLVGLALAATVPVTLMLLGRAALHRDRAEASPVLPDSLQRRDPADPAPDPPADPAPDPQDGDTPPPAR